MADPSTPDPVTDEDRARRLEGYDRIAGAAQLVDLKMIKSRFEVKPEFYITKIEEEEKGRPLTRNNFKWIHSPFPFDRESGMLSGLFRWEVNVTKSRTKLFIADATFIIVYARVPTDVEDDPALAFLRRVGRFATYPYFRSFVSQLNWGAEAELPVLPVLR